ncbi:unnamed protein product, partial [Prunus brigantina]
CRLISYPSQSSSSSSLSFSSSSLFLLPSSLHLLLHGVVSHGCQEKPRTSKPFPGLPWGRLTPLTPWWIRHPSDPAPSSEVVSAENGSKADSEDPKTAAGSEAGDGAAPATAIQKKMRRAERFGISVQMTEEEKRNSRAERYWDLIFFWG